LERCGVFLTVGMNHRQSQGIQIQHTDGCLVGCHAEFAAQFGVSL